MSWWEGNFILKYDWGKYISLFIEENKKYILLVWELFWGLFLVKVILMFDVFIFEDWMFLWSRFGGVIDVIVFCEEFLLEFLVFCKFFIFLLLFFLILILLVYLIMEGEIFVELMCFIIFLIVLLLEVLNINYFEIKFVWF